jgi:hypothetical protein
VEKKIHAGREDGIFVHPQNGFNGLILNWCIGGCWFTPAENDYGIILERILTSSSLLKIQQLNTNLGAYG